jgi:hypothetical protein
MSLPVIPLRDIRKPPGSYLLQITGLFICGALGAVALLLASARELQVVLPPPFARCALAGAVLLLGLVVLRAILLPAEFLTLARRGSLAEDRNRSPWRYPVLALPVVMYLLQVPNASFRWRFQPETGMALASREQPMPMGYQSLADAASSPDQRQFFEGKLVRVKAAAELVDGNLALRLHNRSADRGSCSLRVTVRGKPASETALKHLERGTRLEVIGRLHSLSVRKYSYHVSANIDVEPSPERPLDLLVRALRGDERYDD